MTLSPLVMSVAGASIPGGIWALIISTIITAACIIFPAQLAADVMISGDKPCSGLCNSTCVMPFHTHEWKQIAVCEEIEPLQQIIANLPEKQQNNFRIESNTRHLAAEGSR